MFQGLTSEGSEMAYSYSQTAANNPIFGTSSNLGGGINIGGINSDPKSNSLLIVGAIIVAAIILKKK